MSDWRRDVIGPLLVVAVALGVSLSLAAPLWAGDKPAAETAVKPSPAPASSDQPAEAPAPKAPKSVDVQVFVIMASKGEVESVDPALKELAELLKGKFKDLYNRFRLHKSSQGSLWRDDTKAFALVSDYILWATYQDVKMSHTSGREKVVVDLKVTKLEEMTDDKGNKRKQEVLVVAPLTVRLERDKFILIGGAQVGQETMFLAIRILK